MKTVYLFLAVMMIIFSGCTIEEKYTFKEQIAGKWVGTIGIVFFKDGSSADNLSTGICERQTELILFEDGSLYFEDYIETENNSGGTDFCEIDTKTSDNGEWKVMIGNKVIFKLTNTSDNSELIMELFEVNLIDRGNLEIRYKEFENDEDENNYYYVYKYFRIYGDYESPEK
ncbi:hypothetical protein PXC01_06655 [Maribacter sp. M208]|uniref:hypothetical protein n=1 Tax=Maribacter huludaoensis TaxID=3030010 RepID=UPI0023ECA7F8|nr:hypothetical protein [Maribacter huludaoensis]MDF4221260.1 hypothetical protein [Maribacter huludaoensis]